MASLPPRSILAVAGHENVHVRWLSKLRGYEVTMRFDAATLDAAPAREDESPRSGTAA